MVEQSRAPVAPTASLSPAAAEEDVHQARARPRCRVAVDVRVPGAVGAVAVEPGGRLVGWAFFTRHETTAALAAEAVARLDVRPTEVRLLLGPPTAKVAVAEVNGPPDEAAIVAALIREGHRVARGLSAVGALSDGRGGWVVAACPEETIAEISAALRAAAPGGPVVTVDQLELLAATPPGGAMVDRTERGLTVLARPYDAPPLVRPIAEAGRDGPGDAEEVRRTLRYAAGATGPLTVIGAGREPIARALGRDDPEVLRSLPVVAGRRLPARLELAWRLAAGAGVAAELQSRAVAGMRRERGLIRQLLVAGAVLLAVGLVSLAIAVPVGKRVQARLAGLEGRVTRAQERLEQLRNLRTLQESVASLSQAAGPLARERPHLSGALADLAERRAAAIGWERLQIQDDALELTVSVGLGSPQADLALASRSLHESGRLANLSWKAPHQDGPGGVWLQTFRADLNRRPPGASR